ncbi:MAG: SDR family NAD(P)-dependent oxidoreductase [Wenzhouxiangellaceae bacterium]|nr:SDR family NAD(P)-dependent oxidoreductase [Wenzhouxiangellaceae bacterium]
MAESEKKVALITGAAGALGAALVEQLMAGGWDCIALDSNRRALERLHDRIAAAAAQDPSRSAAQAPLVVPLDLAGAGPQHFDELAEALDQQFGRLDLLVHAAAEFKSLRPIEHYPADEWMQILQTGLTGPFLLSQALLPMMRGTAGSRMIWISDDPQGRQKAYWGAYGVAQGGRLALASILRAECRSDGPVVETIDPGPFHSPLRSLAWPIENPAELPSAGDAARTVLQGLV